MSDMTCPRSWGVDTDLARDLPVLTFEGRRFFTVEPKVEVVCEPSRVEYTSLVPRTELEVTLASGSTSLVALVVEARGS